MTSTAILRTARRTTTALLLAASLGVGAFSHSASTALAPEPAKLRVALGATTGATAAATSLNSQQPTSVRYYSSSWTSDSTGPASGTPCSSAALVRDAVTTQVIQVQGNYRRCL